MTSIALGWLLGSLVVMTIVGVSEDAYAVAMTIVGVGLAILSLHERG